MFVILPAINFCNKLIEICDIEAQIHWTENWSFNLKGKELLHFYFSLFFHLCLVFLFNIFEDFLYCVRTQKEKRKIKNLKENEKKDKKVTYRTSIVYHYLGTKFFSTNRELLFNGTWAHFLGRLLWSVANLLWGLVYYVHCKKLWSRIKFRQFSRNSLQ